MKKGNLTNIDGELCTQKQEKATGVSPDIEGGGMTWFFVCGECHAALHPQNAKVCQCCGRVVNWNE